jgi:ubiquinone biosynthesis protein
MDLALEARTITRFRNALADFAGVWIPDVVPQHSTGAVLTIEHSPGERIDRYAEAHPETRRPLAEAVAALVLHQIFENGLFHADPHPGNLFVLPDGRLCLHDFGNVGVLDERMREGLIGLLDAAVRGDARDVTDGYYDLGLVGSDVDREALEQEIARLLRTIRERPLADVSVGDALQSLLRVGSAHRVRNPGVLLLLGRAFLLAEGVMRQLDPEINVVAVFEQELQRVVKGRLSVSRLVQGSRRFAHDLERVFQEAPADVRRALRRIATGDLGTVRSPVMESAGLRASRDLERLVRAAGSGALVIGGALLATIGGWHRVVGDVLLAIGGTGILTVILGAWYAGWRRRARR